MIPSHSLTDMQVGLMRRIHRRGDDAENLLLLMDDVIALARHDCVHFDAQGHLVLTQRGERVLSERASGAR